MARRVVHAFDTTEETHVEAAPQAAQELEAKIKAKEGAESAERFHSLDSKKEQIDRMVQELHAEETSAKDEPTRARLREKRERIQAIEEQLNSHFQALHGLFTHPELGDDDASE